MAGTLTATTIQNDTSSPPTFRNNSVEIGQLCRAWVNFNGTSTVAIRSSFNVSSITDNGTGDYTVNFTTALPNANYSFVGTSSHAIGNTTLVVESDTTAPTTTAVRLFVMNASGTAQDRTYVNVAVFSS